MSLVVTNQGEARALEIVLNKVAADNLEIRLFKNNYTPVAASTLGNFTEADFSGYPDEGIPLVAGDWVVTPGAPSEAEHPQVIFESNADQAEQLIYGYYVVEANPSSNGIVRWAERFSTGPMNIENNGDQIKITPVFEAASVIND